MSTRAEFTIAVASLLAVCGLLTISCTSSPRLAPVLAPNAATVATSSRDANDSRHLLIILDSIPYDIIAEMHALGRFSYCNAPARVISPFPVMTDPCLTDFFGISPCPAVESAYFDGTRLTNAKQVYERGDNLPWLRFCDYALPTDEHWFSYLAPRTGYLNELAQIQKAFLASDEREFVAYVVGTSATGSEGGRNGHVEALVLLDRFCRQLQAEADYPLAITLMSDHGHNLGGNQRMTLIPHLLSCGYDVGTRLADDNDLVIPQWGLVSSVAIYAKSAAVARDVSLLIGVDLVLFEELPGAVIVLRRGAKARITKEGDSFVYEMLRGDPLNLARFAPGQVKITKSDDEWWQLTKNGDYPDVVRRSWRAFNGLFTNEPTVLVSLEDGYYAGSPAIESFMKMKSVHGNLRRQGSSGFVMTTLGVVESPIRIDRLRAHLQKYSRNSAK